MTIYPHIRMYGRAVSCNVTVPFLSIQLFSIDVVGTSRRLSLSIIAFIPWILERTILRVKTSFSTPWVVIFWTMPFKVTTPVYSPTDKLV